MKWYTKIRLGIFFSCLVILIGMTIIFTFALIQHPTPQPITADSTDEQKQNWNQLNVVNTGTTMIFNQFSGQILLPAGSILVIWGIIEIGLFFRRRKIRESH